MRVAGVLDWLKGYELDTFSAPNAAGEKTVTRTCATEFHNPLTGVLRYKTPNLSLTSGYFSPPTNRATSRCNGAFPANQAGNTLGLLVETITMNESNKKTVKLRVMNIGTQGVKLTLTFVPNSTLGYPIVGEIVDTNADGTDDLIIRYEKDVTPTGFHGKKTQYTRQVRNITTGALMATPFTWVETINFF